MKSELIATYDRDSKRYYRFVIDDGQGIVGTVYVPKDEPVPDNLIIQLRTKGESKKEDVS